MTNFIRTRLSTKEVYEIAEHIANGDRVEAIIQFKTVINKYQRNAMHYPEARAIIHKYCPKYSNGITCMLGSLRFINDVLEHRK